METARARGPGRDVNPVGAGSARDVHTHAPEVEVRWYHEDIGVIEVNIDGTWIEVPSVMTELRGLRAEVWFETVKTLRASFARQAEITRPIVRQAIRDIEALNGAAMRRQGLVVQDWTEGQLRRIDDRIFVGFDVPDGDDVDAADAPQGSTDGFGTALPTGGAWETQDDAAAWKNFADPVSSSKNWIPCPVQAPITGANGPDDLFRKRSKSDVQDILRMLKSLMQGEAEVIVILSGVEELWQIASCDDQVKRRFSKIALPPLLHAKDGHAINAQIATFCARTGLNAPQDPELVQRLVYASRAQFGRCIENIINAIELALLSGATVLDRQHFAESWALQEGCAPGANVFLSPYWSQIDLSAPIAA